MNGHRLRAAAMLLGSVVLLSCGDRRATGPGMGAAHLRVQFAVASDQASGTLSLRVRALWPKAGGGMTTLVESTAQATGSEISVPLELDVATCLAQASRPSGISGCPLSLDIVLLDGQGRYLDSTRVGPLDAVAGKTLTVPAVDVRTTRPVTLTLSFKVSAGGLAPGAKTIAVTATYPLASGATATLLTQTIPADTGQRTVAIPLDVTRCLYDGPLTAGAPATACPLTVRLVAKDAQGVTYDSSATTGAVAASGTATIVAPTLTAARYSTIGFPTGVDTVGGVDFGRSMRWLITSPVFGTNAIDSLSFTRAIKASDTTSFKGVFGVGPGILVEMTRCVGAANLGKTACVVTAKGVLTTATGTNLDSGTVKGSVTTVGGAAVLATDTISLRTVRTAVLSMSAAERLEGVALAGDDWTRHGNPFVIGTDVWFTDGIFPNFVYRWDGANLQTTQLATAFSVNFNSVSLEAASIVWGASSSDIWIASNRKGVIDRVQGGAAKTVGLPWPLTPTSVWGTSANDVWVGTDSGVVLRFNGTSWGRTTLPFAPTGQFAITSIRGTAGNNVYALGPWNGQSSMWRFNGTSWSGVSAPPASGSSAPYTAMLVESGAVTVDVHSNGSLPRSDLWSFNPLLGGWTSLPKLPDDIWVNQISRDASGALVVVGSRLVAPATAFLFRRLPGVYRLVNNAWVSLNAAFPPYSRPLGVAVRNGVTTVVGEDGLLAELNGNSVTLRNYQPYIQNVAVTPNGAAWFATTTGVWGKAPGTALTRVVQPGFDGIPILGLAATSDTSLYVLTSNPATGFPVVYYVNAAGWKQIWTAPNSSVGAASGMGAAVATNNAVFKTTDATSARTLMMCSPVGCGALPGSFTSQVEGFVYSDKLVWFIDAAGLHVYNGASWSLVAGAPANLTGVAGFPNVVVVSDATTIYRSVGGTAFVPVTGASGFEGFGGNQPDDLWTGDCNGHVLRFDGTRALAFSTLATTLCVDQGMIGRRGGALISTGSAFYRGVGPLGTMGAAIGTAAAPAFARSALRLSSTTPSAQRRATSAPRVLRVLRSSAADMRTGIMLPPER